MTTLSAGPGGPARRPGPPASPVAYGLALSGPLVGHGLRALVVDDPGPWPGVELCWRGEVLADTPERLGEHGATLRCAFGGHLVLDRAAMSATFCDAIRPGTDVVAHPGLSGVATVFARWLGRSAFHGGAVLTGDGAWGLVGGAGAGKTSTLAVLAASGHRVLADDLVVLDGLDVLSGPRTLDLRPSAAARLQGDFRLVSVRGGQRRRLVLASVAARVALRGWIHLAVARSLSVERIAAAERPGALAEHLALRLVPAHPTTFLDLASLPAYRLRRPLAWEAMPGVIAALEEIMASV